MSQNMKYDPSKPTLFQVESFGPYPEPFEGVVNPRHMVMTLRYINFPNRKRNYWDMDPDWYGSDFPNIASAAQTKAWYWVTDMDYAKTPAFPPKLYDTVLDRLLNAIRSAQFVHDWEPKDEGVERD